jgi:hypothetical protein
VKRSTDIKIAEVSTSKKKRTKKQTAEAPDTGFGSSRSVRVVRFFPVLTCHSTHNNNIFPRCATIACQSTHSNNIFLRTATIACQSTYNNNKFLRYATTT